MPTRAGHDFYLLIHNLIIVPFLHINYFIMIHYSQIYFIILVVSSWPDYLKNYLMVMFLLDQKSLFFVFDSLPKPL